ncbi:hypothetical protein CK505_09615 [Kocuria sp. WN036]|uniref:hypothetical protein n=1 Tax=Kocuria sp. WN036 TaxID=2032628 RepID=UPI000BABF8E8|nr:hypothetical protein [Kocuria sp. WN036]PAU90613.1 hypothetical protein CK505_09615 [Kocuria sp. WN036]
MDADQWSAQDRGWASRYRTVMTGKHVPESSLQEREHELLDAVRVAQVSAAELFGDPTALATEDAAELATVEEEVRTSLGAGLRPVLQEIGGRLTGISAVAALLMVLRHGWSIDVDIAHVLVAASVLLAFLGWVVLRALFVAGRAGVTISVSVVLGAVVVAGIAFAANLGSGHYAARDVPVVLLASAMLTPGVVLLAVSQRMPQQVLRQEWNDEQWLRRFTSGLRTRLVPSRSVRDHVTEIEQALELSGTSAYAEFGHPLVLARDLAATHRIARTRRWWALTFAGTLTPLVIAALIVDAHSWGALTIPVALAFVLSAAVVLGTAWGDRPWRARQ